jgi:glycosyltransferase involved in cell wall biosynthesis
MPNLVSVVIASHDAASVIEECLEALGSQRGDPGGAALEVVVADSSTDGTDDRVRRSFPHVRLLHFDEPLTLPDLRGRGIAASAGEIIAILDPYSIADADWLPELVRVHAERPNLVVGGAVDLHPARRSSLLAWAAYINEYGMFMPPVRGGETDILPGSNVSYKREALFDGARPRYPVFWKTFVNWEIEARGSRLWLAPQVVVKLRKPVPFLDYVKTRYDHGRCFAGMRVAGQPGSVRLRRALTAPLVPALLLWRWGRIFWSKKRHRGRFLTTLPLQLALFGLWAWGELWGYLRGPGRCCQRLVY